MILTHFTKKIRLFAVMNTSVQFDINKTNKTISHISNNQKTI
jgi:hypothetical protein